jgi:predicted ArsR family transcriptional regulator
MRTSESQEESTQKAVLGFLKRRGLADAKTIAQFCGLTTMAVGRHLLKLQAEGLIETTSRRHSGGRPAAMYSLTEKGDSQFPREYACLANELLFNLVQLEGTDKVRKLFRKRRSAMEALFEPRVEGKTFEQRVQAAAEILTECGYMADAERVDHGVFLLTEHNCAIRDVARCFPVACEEELVLIRDLVGGEVSRVSHLLAGDCHCSYRIAPKDGGKRTAGSRKSKGRKGKS